MNPYNDDELQNNNTISFGTIDTPGVIAVALVWGYFGGPPSQREKKKKRRRRLL